MNSSSPSPRNVLNKPDPNAPVRLQGVTLRALIIGIILIPIMCIWNEYTEIVAQATDLAAMSLPIAVVFAIVVLIIINLVIRRFSPRYRLTQAELLYIFLMQTVSIGISGIGMIQFLSTGVANIYHFATPENKWAENIQPLLKPWILPDEKTLHGFFYGRGSIYDPVVLKGWILPIVVWSSFIFVLLSVMLCINVIIRKQWMDRERLNFPITALPLELTKDGGAGYLLNSKLFWAGLALPVIIESLASLNYLYPSIPFIPIKPSDPRLDLTAVFNVAPWNGMGYTVLSFYPLVIGLTYFLSLDIGFSLWFFYLFTKFENVWATSMGYHDPGASLSASRMPYIGEQSVGAFIALAILVLWGMRKHISDVFRKAFLSAPDVNDTNEPLPYRWAVIGMIVGFIILNLFAIGLGMSWWVPIVLFFLYFMFIITFTRIRAEAGLPWGFGPDINPHQVMIYGAGTRAFNSHTLAGMASLLWFDLDYRCVAMPHQLEAMKLGDSAKMNNRHIAYCILLATIIGAFASWWAILSCYYQYGADTAYVNGWRTYMGKVPWMTLKDWLDNPIKPDLYRMQGAGIGMLVTGFLMFMRLRFYWWPFHPVGYAISGTSTMTWLWCATFFGWLIKVLVIRYGGMKNYKLGIPFFIGLIIGDYIIGSLWAIYGSITGVSTYRAFPI